MRLAKTITAIAACSLAMSSAIAAPAASKLSLSGVARASSTADESNDAAGGFLIPAVAVIAVIAGAIVLSNDSGEPTSP
ncbi:hypothetical protein [Sphingomonas sp.]|uniref:hypothetical protein n=1 Tax=Sphingomonas sp. TaxID=28214 RepID=UPI001EBCF00B|nr:hypothetical protein [Sphingomonas sp.]MBX3594738.1 hypothetical protein [Sphingomonas sp.]